MPLGTAVALLMAIMRQSHILHWGALRRSTIRQVGALVEAQTDDGRLLRVGVCRLLVLVGEPGEGDLLVSTTVF